MNVRQLIALLATVNPEAEVIETLDTGSSVPVLSIREGTAFVVKDGNVWPGAGYKYRTDELQGDDELIRQVATVELSFNPKRE